MGADALLLNIPSGTFELRKARLVGGAPSPSNPVPLRHVENGLRSALWANRLAMIELLGPGRATALMLNNPQALIRALLLALEMGRLELAPPNEGKPEGSADDAAWAAYNAFQAQVGREFTVAARSHRLVPRERVGAVQRERDYDVVPASEAASIVGTIAKTRASGSMAPHMKALLASICDMRGPSKQEGFVLLREPSTQAARYVAPEDVITPAKLKKLKEDGEANHDVVFEFITNTGHPIEDDAGYDLIFPDGRIESGKLANGKAERRGVKPGTYTLRTKYIRRASWLMSEAQPFERVGVSVSTSGFADGTCVELTIRPSWAAPDAPPLATLQANVVADSADTSWAYEQPVGGSPYQNLVVEASIGKKKAWSDELVIKPESLETPRGVQDRLRALGYDPGPPATETTEALKAAVKSFQDDHPPLIASGELDELTVDRLYDQIP